MTGVTDLPFRRLVARFGAGIVVSEMIATSQLVAGEEEARLKLEGEGIAPHVVQLAGREPGWMAEAARIAEASGAAVIDLNMGCPAKKVVGGLAGAALMRDEDRAVAIVEAVAAAVRVPVTVKMRLGWDRTSMNAPALARRMVGAGAVMITVHGRTRDQFYEGRADWDAVAAVRAAVAVPLVVNGDIVDGPSARAALARSGADGVMIGRAAVGRPWLVGAIGRHLVDGRPVRDPPLTVQRDVLLEHHDAALTHYGAALGQRMVRKHLAAAIEAAAGGAVPEDLRLAILTSAEPAPVRRAIRDLFDRLTPAVAA